MSFKISLKSAPERPWITTTTNGLPSLDHILSTLIKNATAKVGDQRLNATGEIVHDMLFVVYSDSNALVTTIAFKAYLRQFIQTALSPPGMDNITITNFLLASATGRRPSVSYLLPNGPPLPCPLWHVYIGGTELGSVTKAHVLATWWNAFATPELRDVYNLDVLASAESDVHRPTHIALDWHFRTSQSTPPHLTLHTVVPSIESLTPDILLYVEYVSTIEAERVSFKEWDVYVEVVAPLPAPAGAPPHAPAGLSGAGQPIVPPGQVGLAAPVPPTMVPQVAAAPVPPTVVLQVAAAPAPPAVVPQVAAAPAPPAVVPQVVATAALQPHIVAHTFIREFDLLWFRATGHRPGTAPRLRVDNPAIENTQGLDATLRFWLTFHRWWDTLLQRRQKVPVFSKASILENSDYILVHKECLSGIRIRGGVRYFDMAKFAFALFLITWCDYLSMLAQVNTKPMKTRSELDLLYRVNLKIVHSDTGLPSLKPGPLAVVCLDVDAVDEIIIAIQEDTAARLRLQPISPIWLFPEKPLTIQAEVIFKHVYEEYAASSPPEAVTPVPAPKPSTSGDGGFLEEAITDGDGDGDDSGPGATGATTSNDPNTAMAKSELDRYLSGEGGPGLLRDPLAWWK
ncbi:hypothetical protein TRAPUB_4176, partial [Trametes pubescens]